MKEFIKLSIRIACLFLLIVFASCKTQKRNTTYFSDLKNSFESIVPIENRIEIKIQPNDQLNITVNSLNAETNSLFNTGTLQTPGSSAGVVGQTGYLVDKDGFVRFPIIGKIKLAGLTVEEATDKLTNIIGENYVKNPIINIHITNFKVTVMGEVKVPQTIIVENGIINIIEALARSGDLTANGDPTSVLIIREASGLRSTTKVNLLKKEVLNSPYFNLRQNDIVYVQPDKILNKEANSSRTTIAIVLSLVSTLSLLYYRFF
ncbi:polysaccharide biosynthesis/export family protein [Spirosoma sp. KNUC1025]|uniref:polysaccharide biosynthesis/export family protein n=1 Tax=Spirosoma sp. KNUC1025 TaxID=2894082 RepID=UPI00386BF99B|nr:polysaccharide biosynthesis/export family protein [Spirosoma sp. KNUC1025]